MSDEIFHKHMDNRENNFNEGKYEWAIKDYDLAIALNPKSANAYNNRGNAKFTLKSYE
ncbi:MAG: tetratricopeptide repeat protein [Burkholderiales bacterium]|nr:tetratricopeptide repeat protein [Burkholderiales bacterium]